MQVVPSAVNMSEWSLILWEVSEKRRDGARRKKGDLESEGGIRGQRLEDVG